MGRTRLRRATGLDVHLPAFGRIPDGLSELFSGKQLGSAGSVIVMLASHGRAHRPPPARPTANGANGGAQRCGRQIRMTNVAQPRGARSPHSTRPVNGFASSGLLAVVALSITAVVVSCAQQVTTPPRASTSSPSEIRQVAPPFESMEGFAWIVAACGGPTMVDGAPNSLLPRASDVRVCVTPPGRAPVLVGVYDAPSVSAEDAAKMEGPHRYATREDPEGRWWIFVVEGMDAAPLKGLERHGFSVH